MKHLIITLLLLLSVNLFAQKTGTIYGTVKDKETQETMVGVTVLIENTNIATATDVEGKFKLTGIPPKSYNLKFQLIGFKPLTLYNINVSTGNSMSLNAEMETQSKELNQVVITANSYGKQTETPLSVQSLTAEEIKSNPGGNFDISKALQILPGVSGTTATAGFRNDIIVRGGSPNENVYYLDGIEVPQINHFATQGSAGGPVGILNVSFIEDASLSSSSFNAKYDNALSSVLQFKQRDGNPYKYEGNFRLSSTELAGTFEGPIGKKATFMASAGRSYLQYLFEAIDLPIRPNYWDFQYKITYKIDPKTTLTSIGIGAIDDYSFAVPKKSSPENEYVLRAYPLINQWTYTMGVSLKHLINKGYWNLSLSRNMFNNRLDQFEDAQNNDESKRTLKTVSEEIENKLRFDVNKMMDGWKLSYGLMAQYVEYNNNTFAVLRKQILDTTGAVISPAYTLNFTTALEFFKYGAFASLNKKLLDDKLSLTIGIRTDGNSFMTNGNNFIKNISPRVALSYALNTKWNINASVGRYSKIPIYTVLGFKDNAGSFVNKDNDYIFCNHFVTGLEYNPNNSLRMTLEGFYKQYSNYPVSYYNGISLANEGGDFGAIGNERIASTGKGRSYGIELFAQQKLINNFFITASYTFFWSEFTGINNEYIPSAWDTRHLLSCILGKKFNKGWEMGLKFRFTGGSPYTPFDMVSSQQNYATTGVGLLDYSKLNTLKLQPFKEVDLRIDKKIYAKHVCYDIYLDFTNAFMFSNVGIPSYTFKRKADNSGFATTDGNTLKADGSNGIPIILNNQSTNFTPSLGFIIEF
ncbi:MAG: TonB-dependent receptor [Bacteroidota bacterium]